MRNVRTFSSGRERREKGSVGKRLLTSLKNARDDFTLGKRITIMTWDIKFPLNIEEFDIS